MKNIALKKVVGSAAATVVALSLTVGLSGVASAAKHTPSSSMTVPVRKVAFQGRIKVVTPVNTTVTPATPESVTVVNSDGVGKTFTVTDATKILRSGKNKNVVTLMVGERVVVVVIAATPTVANSVNVLALNAGHAVVFQGRITVVTPANSTMTPATPESVTVVNKAGTMKVFAFTNSTKVLRAGSAKHPVTLLAGERVIVRALASTPLAPLTINVVAAK